MVGELLTPLLQKNLSRDERNFYNILANGIDSNIMYTVSWLKTHEASSLLDYDDWEDFDEAFIDSQLYAELNKRIKKNVDNGISTLPAFYRKGTRLAALDLHTHPEFISRDQQALNILFDYNSELIQNVNVDFCLGLKDIIGAGALAGLALSKLTEQVVQSPYRMTRHSGATVNMRCTMIASTEYSRAVNTGVMQCYVNKGVYSVDIITAGDDRVCVDCIEIERNNPYSIEEAMNLLPVHPDCYDKETEVFTNHGWKYFKDVTHDDKILSLNPDTLETEFVDYVQKIEHKNTVGYMYHIHNKWFDTCVTPTHDCFILQRKLKDGVRDYYPEFRKPDELNSESYFLRTVENTTRKIGYSACTVDVIDYDDLVYCLELPKYHTLYTRRNGKVTWNGNCRCSIRADNRTRLDPSLTRDWVVNMTDNEYTLDDVGSYSDAGYTVN